MTVSLPERVYAMDVRHPLLVVGTAERHILVYNLAKPDTVYKALMSPLKWQTRCVACFPGKPSRDIWYSLMLHSLSLSCGTSL